QHLDPHHTSLLTEILAKSTTMRVVEARSGLEIMPNVVYVITPGMDLLLDDGKLRSIPRKQHHARPRAIDTFLLSLAQHAGKRAVGVILSGTGSDGTLGIKAIKEEGGITFAQDISAAHHGMPDSAHAGGFVDFVLPPERIAEELVRIAHH